MRPSTLVAIVLLAAAACSGGQGAPGADGKSHLLRSAVEAPGARCANGGAKVEEGADDDGNRTLDDAEVDSVVFVCNGADGQSAAATAEGPGANCPEGGVKLTSPGAAPVYVCSGAKGATGATGPQGESVAVTPEPAGDFCTYGGQRLQVGTGTATYVCNGAPGATGATGPQGESVTVTPEPAGDFCAYGGQKVRVGTGAATYVCNGAPGVPGATGPQGDGVTLTPEPPGPNCGLGGVKLQVGKGSPSYLCSGAPIAVSPPTVTTVDVAGVRYTEATVHAVVADDGSELVFQRGAVVATHPAPTLHDIVYLSGPGAGPFAAHCDGLAPSTRYYARAFATNALGTTFGEERTFLTPSLTVPTLTTQAASNVTDSSAISGGDVVDDGGAPISARGVCWAPAANPTTAGTCANGGAGAGSFMALVTGLASSATYHARAYATNALGTSYGDDLTFTTVLSPLATVTTSAPASVSYTTASGGGTVVDDHGAPVTSRGICWATTHAPTWAGTCYTEAGGLGAFTANMTGLAAATTYYARAFAVNGGGASYGNEVTFTTLAVGPPALTTKPVSGVSSYFAGSGGAIVTDGGSPITAKGVCWGLNPNPTTADGKTNDGVGVAAYGSTMTGLTKLTAYHVRAYATNAQGTSYGEDRTFTTSDLVIAPPSVPVVGTSPSSMTGSSTASSGGYVSNDGGSAVTARGVCWSTDQNPTLGGTCSTDGGTGVGFFTSTITGLGGCGVVYYVRAYATNSTGTGYGNQTTASTGLLPTVTTAAVTNIGDYGATSGGEIPDDGGCSVTEKGVVWSWNPNPTTANPRTTDGTGSAPFASSITGLYGNRTYYARAYATNSVGTVYGPQVVFTTTEPATPYLGQNYGGGIVFYVDGSGHGLVAAPADVGGRPPWGCTGTSIATGTALWTGATNTAAIVASCGEAGIAAKVADSLVVNGYDDWFLPSMDELFLMRTNLYAQGLGGLDGNWRYWSSSEASPGEAWALDISVPYWLNYGKVFNWRVRPVRAF